MTGSPSLSRTLFRKIFFSELSPSAVRFLRSRLAVTVSIEWREGEQIEFDGRKV